MIAVAAVENTSCVCDPSLLSYALEQPELLNSHDYKGFSPSQVLLATDSCIIKSLFIIRL